MPRSFHNRSFLRSSRVLSGLFLLGALSLQAGAVEDYVAITAADPSIPTDQLAIMLMPLTQDEILVEADAWMALVKAKSHEIAASEIASKYKKEEIKTATAAAKAVEKLQTAKDAGADQEDIQDAVADADAALSAAKDAETSRKVNKDAKAAEEETIEALKEQAKASADAPDVAVENISDSTANVDTLDSDTLHEAAEAAKDATEAKTAVRVTLLERAVKLREERTSLLDRMNTVLHELTKKGGDAKPYQTYVDAISGIDIDVTDMEAVVAGIKGWTVSQEGGLRWVRNIVVFVLTVFVFWIISVILSRIVRRVLSASKNITTLLCEFASVGVRRVVLIIGVIVGLSALEVDIAPLLAVVGAAGFVVAFALQDTLGNFASGIMILAYRPFDVGDVVEVSGVSGTVKALNLVSVHIKTFDNQDVIVPNNTVWNNVITNVTGSLTRRVDMVFGIGYQDDIQKAQEILENILAEHDLALKRPEPVVRLHELADSSVNFICRPWVKTADYWTVYWDVTRKVKERFDAEGISIPYPQQDIHIQHLPEIRQNTPLKPQSAPPASGGDYPEVGNDDSD